MQSHPRSRLVRAPLRSCGDSLFFASCSLALLHDLDRVEVRPVGCWRSTVVELLCSLSRLIGDMVLLRPHQLSQIKMVR